MNTIFILILGFIITFFEFECFDYLMLKKYCKKHKGVCAECAECWSCPRKKYIDEYKINKRREK